MLHPYTLFIIVSYRAAKVNERQKRKAKKDGLPALTLRQPIPCLSCGKMPSPLEGSDDLLVLLALLLDEIVLGSTAKGADPIGRNILKVGVFGDSVIGISRARIVLVAAKLTNVDNHNRASPFSKCNRSSIIIYHIVPVVNTLFPDFLTFFLRAQKGRMQKDNFALLLIE
jgi:hypothetical protein